MDTTLSEDEATLAAAFSEQLARQLDVPEVLTSAEVSRIGKQLAESGWLEMADPAGDVAQHFWVLERLAELSGARAAPIPFPLLETWTAIHALRRADADPEPYVVGARTVTLAPASLWDATPGTAVVPFAGVVDDIVVLRLHDAGADVHIVPTSSVTLVDGPVVDDTMPTASFEAAAAYGHDPVGTLDLEQLSTLRARYLTLQTAEMVGLADDLFKRTVEYLGQREQFGKKLSSFQALQHRAADALVHLETSRSLSNYAGWSAEVHPTESEPYALMAKGYAGEHCWNVANEAIQLHGGIGFTWEAGLQHNLARISLRSLSGLSATACLARGGMDAIGRGDMLTMFD